MTGLEALLTEVESIVQAAGGKNAKAMSISLQVAADRAKREQLALIRCLSESQKSLEHWSETSKKNGKLLDTYGSNAKKIFRTFLSEIQAPMASLEMIVDAFSKAESARISSSSSSGVGKPVLTSPLDMLSRGSMGEEISRLVSCMRLQKDELAGLPLKLKNAYKILNAEIYKELNSLESAKREMLDKAVHEIGLPAATSPLSEVVKKKKAAKEALQHREFRF